MKLIKRLNNAILSLSLGMALLGSGSIALAGSSPPSQEQGGRSTVSNPAAQADKPTAGSQLFNPNLKPLVSASDAGPGKAYEVFSTVDGRTRIAMAPPIEGCNAGLVFLPHATPAQYWCPGYPCPPGTTVSGDGKMCLVITTAVQNQTIACPAGQTGSITQTRTVTTTNGVADSPPWTTTANTCQAVVVVPPVVVPPPFIPSGGGGGGGGSIYLSFGGNGSAPGFATLAPDQTIRGTWTGSIGGATASISFNAPSFSGTCEVGFSDAGFGNYNLGGSCGSGYASSNGQVGIDFSTGTLIGSFKGTWNSSSAAGTVTANLVSGQMLNVYQSGNHIGIIVLEPSGSFTGMGGASTFSGKVAGGRGWATTSGGGYVAAMAGQGMFGTANLGGVSYALGGTSLTDWFAVAPGGGIVATGSIMNVPENDSSWAAYFQARGIPVDDFNAILSVSTDANYHAGKLENGAYIFDDRKIVISQP